MADASQTLTGSSTPGNSYDIYQMVISNDNLYVAEDDQNVVGDHFGIGGMNSRCRDQRNWFRHLLVFGNALRGPVEGRYQHWVPRNISRT
jgi:hypothetical protein